MSATDELLQANEAYAATFSGEELKAHARIHASPFITHKNARGSSSTSPRAGCKK